jgi:hypothetical protein
MTSSSYVRAWRVHRRRRSSFIRHIRLVVSGSLQSAAGRLCSRKQSFSTGGVLRGIGSVLASLGARYPNVRVEADRIFIADDPMWTSAGMTAGIDLTLALIEGDLGLEAARTLACRICVVPSPGRGAAAVLLPPRAGTKIGQTPSKTVENVRLEGAHLMKDTNHSIGVAP